MKSISLRRDIHLDHTPQKMKETADLVTFTEEILNVKLHFLCNVRRVTSFKQSFNERLLNLILIDNDNIWDKVFKNGPSKICGTQLLKNLKIIDYITSNF